MSDEAAWPSEAATRLTVRPDFAPTQEMRFAVVMYGGVSLAIYINGVVQELLSLVRATAPLQPAGDAAPRQALLADHELKGTERVYRQLGQLLGWGVRPAADAQAPAEAPIRTRFVVDVLSGSSAGGINAIFLGKALASEQSLEGLKRLWVEQADLALLVNDGESLQGTALAAQKPPQSMLNSGRLYWQVLAALDGMQATVERGASGASRLVDELDCWITATDIRGTTLPIDLYDRFVFERKHRKAFHFVYGSGYARGSGVNDFVRTNDPFLAFAARATSAFPFAFEPMELSDIDAVLAADPFRTAYPDTGSGSAAWDRFFEEYLQPGRAESVSEAADQERRTAYRTQAFGDGGYLDNKPFTWATGSLDRRRADVPVDRRLLYIEPDPGAPHAVLKPSVDAWVQHGPLAFLGGGAPPEARPNPLANVQAALVGLPRYETIREDLERLIDRNREVDRAREVTSIVDEAPLLGHTLGAPVNVHEWRGLSLASVIDRRSLQYGAYHRLKVACVLDELAQLVTRLSGFDETSDEYAAIRCFIQAWANRRYPESGVGPQSQNELFVCFDLSYRLRRIDFLQTRIDLLLGADRKAHALLRKSDPSLREPSAEQWTAMQAALTAFKFELNEALVHLRTAGRRLRRRTADNPILRELRLLGFRREQLRDVLNGAKSKEESVARASAVLLGRPSLYAQISRVAESVSRELAEPMASARKRLKDALAALPEAPPTTAAAKTALQHFFEQYEQYDSVLWPLAYARLGESDRVEVVRISPEDATDLVDEGKTGRRKLGGIQLHHFGGFLDRGWRKNDLLWGRLDGAERLIRTILPPGPTSDDLLRQAQLAIIEEEFGGSANQEIVSALVQVLLRGTGEAAEATLPDDRRQRLVAAVEELRTPGEILEFMKSAYDVDRRLDAASSMRTASRAARVTAKVLDGISGQQPVSWVTRWLSRMGLVLWGLVEVSTPQTFPHFLWRYWRQLLLLISLAMIVVGLVFNVDGAAHAGWIGVVVTLVSWLVAWALEDVFARSAKPPSPLPATLPPPGSPPAPRPSAGQRTWHALKGRALGVLGIFVGVLVALAALEIVLHLGDDVRDVAHWLSTRTGRWLVVLAVFAAAVLILAVVEAWRHRRTAPSRG